MTKIEIEDMDTGFIVTHEGKSYAFGSTMPMITKVKSIFGITKGKKKKSVKDPVPSAPAPTLDEEPDNTPAEPEEPETPNPVPEPVIFKELDRISKSNLAKYTDILGIFNLGYHDQGEGKLVICYGTTKVYTSWEDMFKLPEFINDKSIKDLNNLKQVAVRHFRKWMADHPDLLPDGVDPDADFRPQLKGVINTKTGNDGEYENTSGGYGDE